ncbi:MAG: Ornithine carbamoyltransferase, anabolic [Candidatus Argoarchaeum ethanivorans]|uniref:Ornithine carbamoyltransferase n=1 Tax=Candidatus Argoarchaeum ethanivorans TaxID=2608793 RepID=A0A812A0J4_9EURY|nr:MAG: Ornithine carbamoyltransferase, anabolic [Candidatus Argoarchaeum ethanivorans]
MKHLLSIQDLAHEEIISLLDRADDLKEKRKRGKITEELKHKTLVMLFEKSSTRTRISFEVAMRELGGGSIYLNPADTQLGRGESIADTAKVVSRYAHAVAARVNHHSTLVELAEHSTIPVINALSDIEHPCQLLADLMTIREYKGHLKGLTLSWIGDGNNVCNSAILACSLEGIHINIATPRGYEPDQNIVMQARELGGSITLTDNPEDAAAGADVLYTDVWVSMGNEAETMKRLNDFKEYQINNKLLQHARNNVTVLHCLPAHKGEEITGDVADGQHSAILDQAENRLHTQKALLLYTQRE